jgi:transcription elongation factor GreA
MKYLTKEGFKKLKEELEERKTKNRREIARDIKEAKEQGDLSENAEYSEAKSQQRENESRIMALENIIRTSKVVGKNGNNSAVEIGSEIEVKHGDKKMIFYIVGSNEANPTQGKISNESPIGRVFIGKKKGERVEVVLPNKKKIVYKILTVK